MLVKRVIVLKSYVQSRIKYNYNYDVMKILYELMTVENPIKALKIHDNGYAIGRKKLKLFNFHLIFDDKVEYKKDFIELDKDSELRIAVSGVDEIVNLILKGLITSNRIKLNDADYKVISIENDKRIRFDEVTLYKVRTAVVEAIQDSDRNQIYTDIFQNEFYTTLAGNLKSKYKAVYKKDYTGELFFDIENLLNAKRKYIEIKPNSAVTGYSDFEIFVQADKDMQKIVYYLGLGKSNSLGFGSVSYINSMKLIEE
ncbi:MAG: CRISPR-associated endoribonuclease Cas6 [Clostridium sp.]|nr:CRISPR-associated endoribonuclease Cas6 [Clostridium sp.]